LRVLHIWDICDNSAIITRKLTTMGHQSFVIHRKKMTVRLIRFVLNVIFHLLTFRADIIHINAWDKGVFPAKLLSPRSKIIMHYHGNDIRGKMIPFAVKLCVDKICVSTCDLLEYCPRAQLLPVLVGEEFYYRGGRERRTILTLDQENRLIESELMPFILSLFEYYRDRKRIKITSSQLLSKTGMEAIACGTKVIADSGEIVTEFPKTTIKEYIAVYNTLWDNI